MRAIPETGAWIIFFRQYQYYNRYRRAFCVATVVGGNQTRRIELIHQIIEKLSFDKDIAWIMYMIDYGTSWYDRNFHNREDDLEYRVDKVLSFLNYVCYLRKEKSLGKREFRILCYEVNRV